MYAYIYIYIYTEGSSWICSVAFSDVCSVACSNGISLVSEVPKDCHFSCGFSLERFQWIVSGVFQRMFTFVISVVLLLVLVLCVYIYIYIYIYIHTHTHVIFCPEPRVSSTHPQAVRRAAIMLFLCYLCCFPPGETRTDHTRCRHFAGDATTCRVLMLMPVFVTC